MQYFLRPYRQKRLIYRTHFEPGITQKAYSRLGHVHDLYVYLFVDFLTEFAFVHALD